MIFAELLYEDHYSDIHDALVKLLESKFQELQHGHQGDSWIWIYKDGDKVEIDTFYSMKHQIKCANLDSKAPKKVIEILSREYQVNIYDRPGLEPYE